LSADERAILQKVRTFMESKVQPIINKYWVADAFPFEVLPAFKELNIGGLGYEGHGCAGGSQLLVGLVGIEMARVDVSIATFFGVHSHLAMGSIALDGSEEQKQKWLPPMARLEKIGCFGLTEPLVGSGTAGGLTTTAKREGDTWVLNGQKRWIGNARTRSQSAARRQLVPRHGPRAARDAVLRGLGSDRMPDGRLRARTQIHAGAVAVRKADRLVPDDSGSPR
jgi:alkylation response protein AidB-like acyl-CoA dehydrogenase